MVNRALRGRRPGNIELALPVAVVLLLAPMARSEEDNVKNVGTATLPSSAASPLTTFYSRQLCCKGHRQASLK